MESKSFYITTPLYYVNDKPHIGHAYTTILCDAFARFNRLLGNNVCFLTGTDEHGEKIDSTAKKLGKSPQEHVDAMAKQFIDSWKVLNINYDDFIRTTEERHKKVVHMVVNKLIETGDIYLGKYEGWYCIPCESFWSKSQLNNGLCPDCNRDVKKIEEENFFFKLLNYQEWLIEYINKNPDFILPRGKRHEVESFLKEPLEDLCISRPKSRLEWGIPFPGRDEFVIYVWFDALLNYISAIGYGSDGDKFKANWPANIQLMGKDILRQHAIYWPIMLKAIGIEMPQHVFAHGWWTIAGDKMSKSRGNVVDPNNMSELYGVDTFRYYMLREASLGTDGAYSEDLLIDRLNRDLANDLGNLLHRSLSMLEKYFNGVVPQVDAKEIDLPIKQAAESLLKNMTQFMNEKFDTRAAIGSIWALIDLANKYVEDSKPWTLAKDESKKEELKLFLYVLLETIRFVGLALSPFLPETSEKILGYLQSDVVSFEGLKTWGLLRAGARLQKGEPLFKKVQ